MGTIRYTALDRGHLPQIAELHAATTQRRAEPGLLAWQFFDPSLPAPGILVGAWDGERLAGTQGFIPTAAMLGDQAVLTVKSELTLVNPAYRGQGLFDGMYKLGLELCAGAGIACVWGFTSAVKPFQKVGFDTSVSVFDEYVVLRPARYALARKLAPKPLPEAPLPSADTALKLAPAAAPGTLTLVPDLARLRYRYAANPWTRVVGVDAANGVLYSQDRGRTDIVRLSEAPSLEAVARSIRGFAFAQRPAWRALYRFTNRPLQGPLLGRAVIIRRPSAARLVFRWVGEREGNPLPRLRIEEGFKEGV